MEIINYITHSNAKHLLAHFLGEVMCAKDIHQFGKFDATSLEIELKINGIIVDIVPTFNKINEYLEALEKKADDSDINEVTTTLLGEIDEFIRDKREGLGVFKKNT